MLRCIIHLHDRCREAVAERTDASGGRKKITLTEIKEAMAPVLREVYYLPFIDPQLSQEDMQDKFDQINGDIDASFDSFLDRPGVP